MTCAYDRSYLEKSKIALGRMLDYAVYDLKFDLSKFWEKFLVSPVSRQFESGDVSIIAGRSGIELCLMVLEINSGYKKPRIKEQKSKEYWTGWALAHFQWKSCLSFSQITSLIPIDEIMMMYSPYHEMDIRQFCDRMLKMYLERKPQTNLKQQRQFAGISQSQLAEMSGVPLRTLQQYEQGQKNINKANAEYIISLSQVLYCDPKSLLEPNTDDFII